MKLPRDQKTPSNPSSPTSTTHEPTSNPSLPKDYKKVVQSLIHSRNISLDLKIQLWKRFAEYEACVDEENHANDQEEPAFTATSVSEIGPDVEMPVPWMESVTSDGGEDGEGRGEGRDGDSGYGGNGSNSVDGVEQVGGEGDRDAVPPVEGEGNSNAAEQNVEEEVDIAISEDDGQERDEDDTRNGDRNRRGSLDSTGPSPRAASTRTTTIPNTSNQETEAATNDPKHPDLLSNTTTNHPTPHQTPPTPTPLPRPPTTSTSTFAQCRLDIRNYVSDLAERERLLAAREKWVVSRAEALWRNAKVLAGMLGREEGGRGRGRIGGRKRVLEVVGVVDGGGEGREKRTSSHIGPSSSLDQTGIPTTQDDKDKDKYKDKDGDKDKENENLCFFICLAHLAHINTLMIPQCPIRRQLIARQQAWKVNNTDFRFEGQWHLGKDAQRAMLAWVEGQMEVEGVGVGEWEVACEFEDEFEGEYGDEYEDEYEDEFEDEDMSEAIGCRHGTIGSLQQSVRM
ncbi:hypothetical protein VE03_05726 [Pseudogymnoascus sp. 23342-1-I1]|nr:hypothetical protein VE03_05726 [Pseudogymnoascus sp. 23342-1-I1]